MPHARIFHATRQNAVCQHTSRTSDLVMTPPPQICTDTRCRHKRHPLSLDYFRKGNSLPDCYVYHSRCSDCRRTSQIPLPSHLPGPSPTNAVRKFCQRCHRQWSLTRFPNQNQRDKDKYCVFCRMCFLICLTDFLGSTTPTSSQSSPPTIDLLSSQPQTPPPRTPDSTGLTPSSRRALARRRTSSPNSPPSPTPPPRLNRPRRIIQPRHFYGDTPTPSPHQLKQCSRHRHFKPLTDYIDKNTGEEHNICEACRNEIENIRLRAVEIEGDIQCGEEELQRAIGSHGTLATL